MCVRVGAGGEIEGGMGVGWGGMGSSTSHWCSHYIPTSPRKVKVSESGESVSPVLYSVELRQTPTEMLLQRCSGGLPQSGLL